MNRTLDHLYFIAWIAILLILQTIHVPWRDELQPWLVITNTDSLKEFFYVVWYERQPPTQYIMLWIAHKLMPGASPLTTIRIVSGIFSIGMTALIVYFMNLPRAARYLLPLTIFYFKEYSLIARNYPMGVFFVLAAVLAYRHRKWAAMSALLVCTALIHLYFTWIAAIFSLIVLYENRNEFKKHLRYALPVLLVSLAVVIFLRPPPGSPFSANIRIFSLATVIEIGLTLIRAFTGLGKFHGLDLDVQWQTQWWLIVPGILSFFGFLWAIKKGGVSGVKFWLLASFPLFVSATTYNPDTRHAGTIFTAFLVAWLLAPRKPYLLILSSSFAVLSTCIWLYAWKPWQHPPAINMSGAYDFLEKYGEPLKQDKVLILTDSDRNFFTPMGLADFVIFDIRRNQIVKYPYYRNTEYIYNWETWCKEFGAEFYKTHSDKELLLSVPKGASISEACGCKKLDYETPHRSQTDEILVYRWEPMAKNCTN